MNSLLLRAIVIVCSGLTASACGQSEPPAPPPLDIPVIQVTAQTVPIYLDMVGQTRGSVDIPIRARVEGFLESIHFQQGANVPKNSLLYTIDPRPFQAKVVEAKGRLAEAETALAKSKADLDRIRPLAEIKAVSAQDLDSAVAQYEAAIGAVQAAKAQLEQAEIELSYCTIRSPINGLIGITQAEVGEFVGSPPNPVVLNYVSKIDPIRVRFSINEQQYLQFARLYGGRGEIEQRDNKESDADKAIKLILADGVIHPYDGHITAFDAAVDPTTGTLTLEATFPNPNRVVLAGQFARVRGVVEKRDNAILVPQRAVNETQGNFQVFVVDAEGTVELRRITVGPNVDNQWLVESGLNSGETIAVEGLQRLHNGIQVKPKLVDPNELTDNPADGAGAS